MKIGYMYNRVMHRVCLRMFPKAETVCEDPLTDEPSVFVCNHANIIGPVMMTLHFKRRHKSWIVHTALDKTKTANFAFHDIFFGDSRRFKIFWRILSRMVKHLLPTLLKYEDSIPVYHDSKIASTFKQSVKALSEGEDLVIFAESTERYTEYINRLQPGFVDVARLYYRRTGKRLNFYPTYIEKQNAVISIGKPIVYDPDIPIDEQREVITDFLADSIDRLARKLPEHTPAPFLPQRWYDAYGERFEHDVMGYWKMIEEVEEKTDDKKQQKEDSESK